MTTQRETKHQRNFVAKHAHEFNKSKIQPSKKKKLKHGKVKHKNAQV